MAFRLDNLYVLAEEQRERLEALYRLAIEVSELRDVQQVLDTALHHCLELTSSRFGFIGLITDDGNAMDVVAIQGFNANAQFYDRHHLIPLRPSVFARAILENRPVRSEDAMTDPVRIGQPSGHPPVRAFLGVPLRLQGEPIGMIGVANRRDPYAEEHEQLLMTYAAQVAIAIRNAQLYGELRASHEALERKVAERTRELAEAKEALALKARELSSLLAKTITIQERERARIAHDMHDGLNQLIIGAMLEVKAARQRLAQGEQEGADASLQQVRAVLGRVDTEIRRIIHDLRPPSLDALGLPAAIKRYCERYRSLTGIQCDVQLDGEPSRLTSEVEIGIYRVMQEALQNTAAHADASHAWVHLEFGTACVHLEVGDDGCGFDLDQVRAGTDDTLGIISMHERAHNLDGTLRIVTAPDQGTRVRLDVPDNGCVLD